MPATKDTKRGKPTYKERMFAKNYVKNGGNGTHAVLDSYNTTSHAVAGAMSPEILVRPRVQNAIEKEIQRLENIDVQKIDADFITRGIADIATNDTETGANKLKGYELLAKVRSMLTDRVEQTNAHNVTIEHNAIKSLDTDVLLQELTERLKMSSRGINTTPVEKVEPDASLKQI